MTNNTSPLPTSDVVTMRAKTMTLTAFLLSLLAACADVTSAPRSIPGGYAAVPVNQSEVTQAAAFAVEAERQALKAARQPASLELVSVLSAEQQVVAGVNYRLSLKVKRNGQEQVADAVVWWQAWRQPDPYRLTSWAWR